MIEAIAVVLLSIAASDDQLVENLRKCRGIEEDYFRLECFDEAFILAEEEPEAEQAEQVEEPSGGAAKPSGDAAKPSGEASFPRTESSPDSLPVRAAARPASAPTKSVVVIPAEGGQRKQGQPIELSVGCDDGELSVAINWGQYLAREALAVTVKIDSRPPSRSNWVRSEDKQASVFRPTGGKKVRQQKITAFARELIAGQRLAVRAIPRGQTAVTAAFDLSGEKATLRQVRRACAGW